MDQGCPLEGGEAEFLGALVPGCHSSPVCFRSKHSGVGNGSEESLAGHVRSFLPPSGPGSQPGSPCPVIWAWSPDPAHTLQLTQATPAGSGQGSAGWERLRGPSSQAPRPSRAPSSHSEPAALTPVPSYVQPSGRPLRSVFSVQGQEGVQSPFSQPGPCTVTPPSWAPRPLAPTPVVCVDSSSWKAGDLLQSKDWS